MGKAVFWSVPAHGDTNPLLGTIQELVERGEEVIYYGDEEFRGVVEKTGATFRAYKGEVKTIQFDLAESDFVGFFLSMLSYGLDKLIHNLDDVRREQPTYVVHGCMCSWGKMLGRLLGVKTVNLIHSAPVSEEDIPKNFHTLFTILIPLMGCIVASKFNRNSVPAQFNKRFGISIDWFDLGANIEDLNVVYSCTFMTPELAEREKSFRFVGPSLNFKNHDRDNNIQVLPFSFQKKQVDVPLIYVSLGTIHSHNRRFVEKCIQAFENKPWQVLISVGKKLSASDFGPLPPNITIAQWVPQQKVLEQVDVFLTHAGMNSVNEALYYGVPMLLFPHHLEQAASAKRVKRLGCGEILDVHKVTPEQLVKMTEKVLETPSYRERARHYSQIVRKDAEQSAKAAADAILEYARG